MIFLLRRAYFLLMGLLLFSVSAVTAQSCPAIVQQALNSVDANCTGLDRNNACYGYDQVQASFIEAVADDFFTQPADRTDILNLETLSASPLDETAGTWGVSVMKLQANVPNSLPGQAATFVVMGEAEVENAVDPAEAADAVEPLAVEVTAGANIRSGPGLNFNVIAGAPRGTMLPADGLNDDGDWLRVVFRERIGWVNRVVLDENAAIDSLPQVDPRQRSPMQAFYLRTNTALPACEDAPDVLMVQGPRNVEVDLTVNGVNVRIGSTVLFRQSAPDTLEIIVLDGQLQFLNDDYQPTTTVYENFRTTVCLDPPEDRGLDGESNDQEAGCPPSEPQYVGPSPLGLDWCELEDVPQSVLNYRVDLQCPGDTPPQSSVPNDTGIDSVVPDVDCSAFELLAPLQPINPRNNTFSWTAAPGAVEYHVQFYDNFGQPQEVFVTTETQITLNVGQQVSSGGAFSWEVRAFNANGDYACVTQGSGELVRLPDPNPPPVTDDTLNPDFVIEMFCEAFDAEIDSVHFAWSNLPAGSNLVVFKPMLLTPDAFTIFESTATNGVQVTSFTSVVDVTAKLEPSNEEIPLGSLSCN